MHTKRMGPSTAVAFNTLSLETCVLNLLDSIIDRRNNWYANFSRSVITFGTQGDTRMVMRLGDPIVSYYTNPIIKDVPIDT